MSGIIVHEAGRDHPADSSQFPGTILLIAVVLAFILAAIALTLYMRAT
jgi:hypothetical protein